MILLLLYGCQLESNKEAKPKQLETPIENIGKLNQAEQLVDFDIDKHIVDYQRLKLRIAKNKNKIKTNVDIGPNDKLEMAETYMAKILVDSIFPYWLDTKWDFNGHTERPRDGEIACGYFVTTTLRDIGIKLNRFKIAQKAASEIIYALCDRETIKNISSIEKLFIFLDNLNENEILIVGLDFHVGFIFKKNNQHYFAHSNYINRNGVEIELAQNSTALKNSNLYVVGNLTRNKNLTRSWLNYFFFQSSIRVKNETSDFLLS